MALRSFTPTPDYHRFRVRLMEDAWDKDLGKFNIEVTALGAENARQVAVETVKAEYPAACAVAVSRICEDCHHPLAPIGADPGHNASGCRHRSESADAVYPCGCGVAA